MTRGDRPAPASAAAPPAADAFPGVSRWRTLRTTPLGGAANMAVDAAMLDHARATGEGIVRVYTWAVPTVSFGRHQAAAGRYDAALIAADGCDIVRRPTGGRAILHHRELTYAVAAPVAEDAPLAATHAAITAALAGALTDLEIPVSVAEATDRAAPPGAAPCFAEPARGELLAGGAKLVGSAQVREHGAFLQHGSILVDDDQGRLLRYLLVPARPVPPPATLRGLGVRIPTADALLGALAHRLARRTGAPVPMEPRELPASAVRTHVARFRDPAWTWRR